MRWIPEQLSKLGDEPLWTYSVAGLELVVSGAPARLRVRVVGRPRLATAIRSAGNWYDEVRGLSPKWSEEADELVAEIDDWDLADVMHFSFCVGWMIREAGHGREPFEALGRLAADARPLGESGGRWLALDHIGLVLVASELPSTADVFSLAAESAPTVRHGWLADVSADELAESELADGRFAHPDAVLSGAIGDATDVSPITFGWLADAPVATSDHAERTGATPTQEPVAPENPRRAFELIGSGRSASTESPEISREQPQVQSSAARASRPSTGGRRRAFERIGDGPKPTEPYLPPEPSAPPVTDDGPLYRMEPDSPEPLAAGPEPPPANPLDELRTRTLAQTAPMVELPAADDPARYDVVLDYAGFDESRTAQLLSILLDINRVQADKLCAQTPIVIAEDRTARDVRKIDSVVRPATGARIIARERVGQPE